MTKFSRLSLLSALFCMMSCHLAETEEASVAGYAVYDIDLSTEKVYTRCLEIDNRDFNINCFEPDVAMKSTLGIADDGVINEISCYAFDHTTGDILMYGENAGATLEGNPVSISVVGADHFDWSLPIGVEMDIYAVANMGPLPTPANVSDLSGEAFKVTCGDISEYSDTGIPMSGVVTGFIDNSGGCSITLSLSRIAAKYNLTVSKEPSPGVSSIIIDHIRLVHANDSMALFNQQNSISSGKGIDGDYATAQDIEAVNNGSQICFYTLENCISSNEPGCTCSSGPWYTVKDRLSDVGLMDRITAIEMQITQTKSGGYSESVKWYLCLGQDCVTNFDVVRNTVTSINLTVSDIARQEYLYWLNCEYTVRQSGTVILAYDYENYDCNPVFEIESDNPNIVIEEYDPDLQTVRVSCKSSATPGECATLTIRDTENPSVSSSCSIHVIQSETVFLSEIYFEENDIDLISGEVFPLGGALKLKYSDGTVRDADSDFLSELSVEFDGEDPDAVTLIENNTKLRAFYASENRHLLMTVTDGELEAELQIRVAKFSLEDIPDWFVQRNQNDFSFVVESKNGEIIPNFSILPDNTSVASLASVSGYDDLRTCKFRIGDRGYTDVGLTCTLPSADNGGEAFEYSQRFRIFVDIDGSLLLEKPYQQTCNVYYIGKNLSDAVGEVTIEHELTGVCWNVSDLKGIPISLDEMTLDNTVSYSFSGLFDGMLLATFDASPYYTIMNRCYNLCDYDSNGDMVEDYGGWRQYYTPKFEAVAAEIQTDTWSIDPAQLTDDRFTYPRSWVEMDPGVNTMRKTID